MLHNDIVDNVVAARSLDGNSPRSKEELVDESDGLENGRAVADFSECKTFVPKT